MDSDLEWACTYNDYLKIKACFDSGFAALLAGSLHC